MGTDDTEDIVLKRVDRLEPGMVVARDIHTNTGTRLLSAGDVLTFDDIERLKGWSKRSIYIQKDAPKEDEPDNGSNYREAS